jgi:tRNA 2-(methylsulfanyl)-N6-isopentenyladenosine37 hydroxylase
MLGLLERTDPSWVDAAQGDLPGLLSDHAHCELKAAQSALGLLARYGGELPALVEPLSALAREETQHFRQVETRLKARGATLGLPHSDAYVFELQAASKQTRAHDAPALLDKLLVSALIEGRSCERFRLLSEHLKDAGLRRFYRALMAAEAKHFTLFFGLASDAFGEVGTRARFETLAAREATIARKLPLGPTVHG